MSEKEGSDSKFMLGFVTGFLVGVLIALGVGASFVVFRGRHEMMRAQMAREEAMVAREMAEMERARAEANAKEAAAMEQKAKEAAEKALKEVELIGKQPKQEDEADKVKAARVALTTIEKAIDVYKLNHGDYPESLDVLTAPTNDKPALLEAKALLDPWNRKFVYDLEQRFPKTGKPLIYSQGAEPGKSAPIRSWEADDKKQDAKKEK